MGKKKFAFTLSLLVGTVLAGPVAADEVKVGLSIKDEGKKSFYLALGTHYGAKDTAVQFAMKKGIPDDELPVIFYLSTRARVKPELLVGLRLKGMSWADITLHFGMGGDIFYIPFKKDPGPPYGKAWGHYKAKPKAEWSRIVLSDRDIVGFVNLKFMSDHHKMTPHDVVKMKAKGKSFVDVNLSIKKCKGPKCGRKDLNKGKTKSGGYGGPKKSKGGKKGKKSP